MNTKTENNNSANNSVFLDNLFTLCSRKKVEAKDALNGAGINSGYIERWQNGETVTYEMLGLLSFYFHISGRWISRQHRSLSLPFPKPRAESSSQCQAV